MKFHDEVAQLYGSTLAQNRNQTCKCSDSDPPLEGKYFELEGVSVRWKG